MWVLPAMSSKVPPGYKAPSIPSPRREKRGENPKERGRREFLEEQARKEEERKQAQAKGAKREAEKAKLDAEKAKRRAEIKAREDAEIAEKRRKEEWEKARQAKLAAEQKAREDAWKAQLAINAADKNVYNSGSGSSYLFVNEDSWRQAMFDALYAYVEKFHIYDYLLPWRHELPGGKHYNFNFGDGFKILTGPDITEVPTMLAFNPLQKYSNVPGKSTQLNTFLAKIPGKCYCDTAVLPDNSSCVHVFYVDKKVQGNVFSYCILLDFWYGGKLDGTPVTLHTFDASLDFDKLRGKQTPTPSEDATRVVRAQLRRGLVQLQLGPNFQRAGERYTFDAFLTPSLRGMYSKKPATATVDFSDQAPFCSVALADASGSKESSAFSTFDDFAAWTVKHTVPPAKPPPAPLSVKHTERAPSRLAQDALSLLASIERVL